MNNTFAKNTIEASKVLEINNKFRSLGLRPKLKGTKLLNKAVQILLVLNDEFFLLEDVLDELINIYPQFNKKQIKMAIQKVKLMILLILKVVNIMKSIIF